MNYDKVKKMIGGLKNEEHTIELLRKINQGEKMTIYVHPNNEGRLLVWDNTCLLNFDGNEMHNAVSVIRDLLKLYYTKGHEIPNPKGGVMYKAWTHEYVRSFLDIQLRGNKYIPQVKSV